MKPNTTNAMHDLIKRIKGTISFNSIGSNFCSAACRGCSIKLVNFLASEIEDWEYRLEQGDIPSFADLDKLAKTAKKIQAVLLNNNVI